MFAPVGAIVLTSVTIPVTHLTKKVLQMRHKSSVHIRNHLKQMHLQRHQSQHHIPATHASPGWAARPIREPPAIANQQARRPRIPLK
jgi:hypothetical protein